MRTSPFPAMGVVAVGLAVVLCSGCVRYHQTVRALYQPPAPPSPLGTLSDPMWKTQEANAEASDFVIYQHEFEYNGVRLNKAGEDHVRQIAVRLQGGADMPVVIEQGATTARDDTEFQYPVHPNAELDLQRREVVVRSLAAMGVTDAHQRVAVAPAYAHPMKASEASAAYERSFQYDGYGPYGTYGGGAFGPFGGFGGFGGIGGGFF